MEEPKEEVVEEEDVANEDLDTLDQKADSHEDQSDE